MSEEAKPEQSAKAKRLSELQLEYNRACLAIGELIHKEQQVEAESERIYAEINKQKKALRELVKQHARVMKMADDAISTAEAALEENEANNEQK